MNEEADHRVCGCQYYGNVVCFATDLTPALSHTTAGRRHSLLNKVAGIPSYNLL